MKISFATGPSSRSSHSGVLALATDQVTVTQDVAPNFPSNKLCPEVVGPAERPVIYNVFY